MKVSYAQNYEDILIDRLFSQKREGFYVDVGAAHPIKDSVTKYFYNKGWQGINIEPNEAYCDLLKKDRPRDINLWCALGDSSGEIDYFFAPEDPKISFIGAAQNPEDPTYKNLKLEKKKVPLKTLKQVCGEFAKAPIDFLKIDVEGAEEMVLKGMDFDSFKPRLIVVEAVTVKGTQKVEHQWVGYLTKNNYEAAYFDGLNSYYVKSDDLEAKQLYSVPLNASDNFIRYQHTRKQFHFKNLIKF